MKFNRFEEILAWQKAGEMTVVIYKIFNQNRDYGFKDQIQRASVSIMNNIAEGFERKSNNEFKQFLFIAKASCGEVRSMIYLGLKLNYFDENEYRCLIGQTSQVSKMLSGLIKTL